MKLEEFKRNIDNILNRENEYRFLAEDKNLGDNIILLGFGGSYAYGTYNESSDLDIRGVAFNTKRNIILGQDFEQVVETETDTTIYSFDKIVKLLCSCNPNTIEMLGLREEDYIYLSDAGRELLENKKIFLSQVAAQSFGGYADAQLRRLENKSARLSTQTHNEENILKSIENASVDYKRRYFPISDDSIKLYVDKSNKSEYDSEIFMDLNLTHYPLRDFRSMLNDMQNILKGYSKQSSRSRKAVEHDKLSKHMMHLIRLYYMSFDILENGEIITYRSEEHDELLAIRNGKYLDENRQVLPEFYDLVDELEKRLNYAKQNTDLPKQVDKKQIEDFIVYMNSKYIFDGR